MTPKEISAGGLLILGCGKMGSALLKGWISSGVDSQSIQVLDPNPSPWLATQSLSLNQGLPSNPPAVCLIAVKPQIFPEAIKSVTPLGNTGMLVLSIVAGVQLSTLATAFGSETSVIRAMPNTPAAIGHGVSVLVGNAQTRPHHLALAESLLSTVGETVCIEQESDMDAVTALSGSGPAYIFLFIEAMTEAGVAQGLSAELSHRLALATVAGAARLAAKSSSPPSQLRKDVTSPGGTTEAALELLLDDQSGLKPLVVNAVQAAAERSRELGLENG